MSYWCQEYFTFSLNLLNVSFKSLSSWWAFLSDDSLLKRATLALRLSRYIDSCFTCFIQKYKSMFLHQERIRKNKYISEWSHSTYPLFITFLVLFQTPKENIAWFLWKLINICWDSKQKYPWEIIYFSFSYKQGGARG